MLLSGLSFIGYGRGSLGGATFRAFDPAVGQALPELFHSAAAVEIERAAALAEGACTAYSQLPGVARGAFLAEAARQIEALGHTLTARVMAETGLPEARVKGETARTCHQLRLFAQLAAEGSWVDARIDHADPARLPLAKPDLRSMQCACGPVVVFGASNFPLAYSVAGGDTASALAAGCPVVVKAHSAHPGTSELVASAVVKAAQETGMPEGVFSLIFDSHHGAAHQLVDHPAITGIGFTGSRTGGLALMARAAARKVPIPIFAEMSSVNPVLLLPGALASHPEKLAQGLHTSVTLGVGQFCTKPGIILYESGGLGVEKMISTLTELVSASTCSPMLTRSICTAYHEGRDRLAAHPRVAQLASARAAGEGRATPALFATTAGALLEDPSLSGEVFGPSTVLVACRDQAEMTTVIRSLEGQLTISVHGTPEDFGTASDLLAAARGRAGRLIANGFPTGLEVCPSTVHGGPFPSTSDGRSTSVGTGAIHRWVRPICWQDHPDEALPPALQDANPLKLTRLVNGRMLTL